jgi:type VI secretion system ImpM family protein
MSAVLFGKLPAHGDFVVRGLEADARAVLDDWLSASLVDAREALGTAFEDRYDRAPPWRFLGSRAGALAPSQDAAGRRYPVLLFVGGTEPVLAEACELLLYDAIAQSWTADRLLEAAASLDAGGNAPPEAPRWWTAGGEGFAPVVIDGERPASLLAAMLGDAA